MDLPESVNYSDIEAALTTLLPGFEAELTTEVVIGVRYIEVHHFRRYEDGRVERRVRNITRVDIKIDRVPERQRVG